MAQKTFVTLVDDIDGSEADATVPFGLDGISYEIDLSEEHATALRETLAAYVAHARRLGRTPRAGRGTTPSSTTQGGTRGASGGRERTRAIRNWAREQGYTVSERGRIPTEVTAAYERAG